MTVSSENNISNLLCFMTHAIVKEEKPPVCEYLLPAYLGTEVNRHR